MTPALVTRRSSLLSAFTALPNPGRRFLGRRCPLVSGLSRRALSQTTEKARPRPALPGRHSGRQHVQAFDLRFPAGTRTNHPHMAGEVEVFPLLDQVWRRGGAVQSGLAVVTMNCFRERLPGPRRRWPRPFATLQSTPPLCTQPLAAEICTQPLAAEISRAPTAGPPGPISGSTLFAVRLVGTDTRFPQDLSPCQARFLPQVKPKCANYGAMRTLHQAFPPASSPYRLAAGGCWRGGCRRSGPPRMQRQRQSAWEDGSAGTPKRGTTPWR